MDTNKWLDFSECKEQAKPETKKRKSRNLNPKYNIKRLKYFAKFLDAYKNEDPIKALAQAIAYGHYRKGISSTEMNDKGHLSRDVKKWAKKNNLTSEQTELLMEETKKLYEERGL